MKQTRTCSGKKDNMDQVIIAELTAANRSERGKPDNFTVLANNEVFEAKNAGSFGEEDLNGHLVKLIINGGAIKAKADSGSPMSYLNEHLAENFKQTLKCTIWKRTHNEDADHNLAFYDGVNLITR